MIKKLVSHLGEYKAASIKTPLFAALEAIMDVLLPTIMAFIIDQGIEKGDMNAIIRYGLLTFWWQPLRWCWACWRASTPPRHPPALPEIYAMPCMKTSSITLFPTSTNSPRQVLLPA